jgi:hypothetical protein
LDKLTEPLRACAASDVPTGICDLMRMKNTFRGATYLGLALLLAATVIAKVAVELLSADEIRAPTASGAERVVLAGVVPAGGSSPMPLKAPSTVETHSVQGKSPAARPVSAAEQAELTAWLSSLTSLGKDGIGAEGVGPHIERAWSEGGGKEALQAATMVRACGHIESSVDSLYRESDSSQPHWRGYLESKLADSRRCQTLTDELRRLETQLWERAARDRQSGAASSLWYCVQSDESKCGKQEPPTPQQRAQAKELLLQALEFGDRHALNMVASHAGKSLFVDAVQWRAHQIAVAELDRRAGRVPDPQLQGVNDGVSWRLPTAKEYLLRLNPGFSEADESKASALAKGIVDRFLPAKRP